LGFRGQTVSEHWPTINIVPEKSAQDKIDNALDTRQRANVTAKG
jgi:hypothetical protein